MVSFDFVKSSNIKAGHFNEETKELDIEFKNGGRYRYFDVDASDWNKLCEAESAGRYFIGNIKNHKFTRL